MLEFIIILQFCCIFALYLDKIKIAYDKSFRYSQKKNHRLDAR